MLLPAAAVFLLLVGNDRDVLGLCATGTTLTVLAGGSSRSLPAAAPRHGDPELPRLGLIGKGHVRSAFLRRTARPRRCAGWLSLPYARRSHGWHHPLTGQGLPTTEVMGVGDSDHGSRGGLGPSGTEADLVRSRIEDPARRTVELLEGESAWGRDFADLSPEWHRLLAELFKTFLLVLAAAGAVGQRLMKLGGLRR